MISTNNNFHLPDKIRFEEDTLTDYYGKLIVEPLERGFGTTVGNTLRRILYSSIEGAAVYALQIDGVLNEFMTVKGVKEDVVDIILNVKQLRFKVEGNGSRVATIDVSGPGTVTGSDIQTDGNVEVLNKDIEIATLDKSGRFKAELHVKNGRGYVPADLNKEEDMSIDTIAIDSAFSPIRKVNFVVENARVGRATDYDKLILELWTDGSVTPEEAITAASQIMIKHMELLLLSPQMTEVSSDPSLIADSDDSILSSATGAAGVQGMNQNLGKSVDELELSVRSYNCLKNAGIKTIADLVMMTEGEILKTKNFGRKSLNEIKELLEKMGLNLGMKIPQEVMDYVQSGGAGRDAS